MQAAAVHACGEVGVVLVRCVGMGGARWEFVMEGILPFMLHWYQVTEGAHTLECGTQDPLC